MFAYLLQGLLLGLYGVATPGPFLAYLISEALRGNLKRALPLALAPLISDGFIITVVLLVLTHLPKEVFRWLQVIGGVYLLYLAYTTAQDYFRDRVSYATTGSSYRPNPVKAALINLLSPGPYIAWSIVFGPIFLAGWKISAPTGIAFLIGFYVCLIGGYAALIALFASARYLGQRVHRTMIGLSAITLLGFGVFQVASGLFA
jgi:threonine/homoserine/homoserine lactone efflux protein